MVASGDLPAGKRSSPGLSRKRETGLEPATLSLEDWSGCGDVARSRPQTATTISSRGPSGLAVASSCSRTFSCGFGVNPGVETRSYAHRTSVLAFYRVVAGDVRECVCARRRNRAAWWLVVFVTRGARVGRSNLNEKTCSDELRFLPKRTDSETCPIPGTSL